MDLHPDLGPQLSIASKNFSSSGPRAPTRDHKSRGGKDGYSQNSFSKRSAQPRYVVKDDIIDDDGFRPIQPPSYVSFMGGVPRIEGVEIKRIKAQASQNGDVVKISNKKFKIYDNIGYGFCLMQSIFTLIYRTISPVIVPGKQLPVIYYPKDGSWIPQVSTVQVDVINRVSKGVDSTDGIDMEMQFGNNLVPVGSMDKFEDYSYALYNSPFSKQIVASVHPPDLISTRIPLYMSGVGFLTTDAKMNYEHGFIWLQPASKATGVGHYVTCIPDDVDLFPTVDKAVKYQYFFQEKPDITLFMSPMDSFSAQLQILKDDPSYSVQHASIAKALQNTDVVFLKTGDKILQDKHCLIPVAFVAGALVKDQMRTDNIRGLVAFQTLIKDHIILYYYVSSKYPQCTRVVIQQLQTYFPPVLVNKPDKKLTELKLWLGGRRTEDRCLAAISKNVASQAPAALREEVKKSLQNFSFKGNLDAEHQKIFDRTESLKPFLKKLDTTFSASKTLEVLMDILIEYYASYFRRLYPLESFGLDDDHEIRVKILHLSNSVMTTSYLGASIVVDNEGYTQFSTDKYGGRAIYNFDDQILQAFDLCKGIHFQVVRPVLCRAQRDCVRGGVYRAYGVPYSNKMIIYPSQDFKAQILKVVGISGCIYLQKDMYEEILLKTASVPSTAKIMGYLNGMVSLATSQRGKLYSRCYAISAYKAFTILAFWQSRNSSLKLVSYQEESLPKTFTSIATNLVTKLVRKNQDKIMEFAQDKVNKGAIMVGKLVDATSSGTVKMIAGVEDFLTQLPFFVKNTANRIVRRMQTVKSSLAQIGGIQNMKNTMTSFFQFISDPSAAIMKNNFALTFTMFYLLFLKTVLAMVGIVLQDVACFCIPLLTSVTSNIWLQFIIVVGVIALFDQFFMSDFLWCRLVGKKTRDLWNWITSLPDVFLLLFDQKWMSIVAATMLCIPSFATMTLMTVRLFPLPEDKLSILINMVFYVWWIILPLARKRSRILTLCSGSHEIYHWVTYVGFVISYEKRHWLKKFQIKTLMAVDFSAKTLGALQFKDGYILPTVGPIVWFRSAAKWLTKVTTYLPQIDDQARLRRDLVHEAQRAGCQTNLLGGANTPRDVHITKSMYEDAVNVLQADTVPKWEVKLNGRKLSRDPPAYQDVKCTCVSQQAAKTLVNLKGLSSRFSRQCAKNFCYLVYGRHFSCVSQPSKQSLLKVKKVMDSLLQRLQRRYWQLREINPQFGHVDVEKYIAEDVDASKRGLYQAQYIKFIQRAEMKTQYNFLFKSNQSAVQNSQDLGNIKPRCIINPKNTKPVLAAVMKKFFIPLMKTQITTLAAKSPQSACLYLQKFQNSQHQMYIPDAVYIQGDGSGWDRTQHFKLIQEVDIRIINHFFDRITFNFPSFLNHIVYRELTAFQKKIRCQIKQCGIQGSFSIRGFTASGVCLQTNLNFVRNWVGNQTMRQVQIYRGGQVNVCTGDDLLVVATRSQVQRVRQRTHFCYSDQKEVLKEMRRTGKPAKTWLSWLRKDPFPIRQIPTTLSKHFIRVRGRFVPIRPIDRLMTTGTVYDSTSISESQFHNALSYSYAPGSNLGMQYYDAPSRMRARAGGKIHRSIEVVMSKLYGAQMEFKMLFSQQNFHREQYLNQFVDVMEQQIEQYQGKSQQIKRILSQCEKAVVKGTQIFVKGTSCLIKSKMNQYQRNAAQNTYFEKGFSTQYQFRHDQKIQKSAALSGS